MPDPGPARVLALATLVNTMGNGLFLTGSVLFFTRVIGLSPAQVGLGLSAAGICGMVAGIPLGRWGKVAEIGHLAVYLCSEEAGFITGTDIVIDGGWTAR